MLLNLTIKSNLKYRNNRANTFDLLAWVVRSWPEMVGIQPSKSTRDCASALTMLHWDKPPLCVQLLITVCAVTDCYVCSYCSPLSAQGDNWGGCAECQRPSSSGLGVTMCPCCGGAEPQQSCRRGWKHRSDRLQSHTMVVFSVLLSQNGWAASVPQPSVHELLEPFWGVINMCGCECSLILRRAFLEASTAMLPGTFQCLMLSTAAHTQQSTYRTFAAQSQCLACYFSVRALQEDAQFS